MTQNIKKNIKEFSTNLVVPRIHSRQHLTTQNALKQSEQETEPDGIALDILPSITCHPPFFIIIISGIEIILFLYEGILLSETCNKVSWEGPVPKCSPLIYNPDRRWEAWRWMSYSLVHAGYIHILSNITVQLFLGIPLEIVHGSWRVAFIYCLGILAGSLATSLTDPTFFLAGASGGVYALMVAHLPTLILNWHEMKSLMEWLVHVLMLLVGLVDLIMSICTRYIDGKKDTSIGYSAHIAGAVTGFAIGINIIRNLKHKKWEGSLRLLCVLTWSLFAVVAILWNSLASQFFMASDWSPLPGYACKVSQNECSSFPKEN